MDEVPVRDVVLVLVIIELPTIRNDVVTDLLVKRYILLMLFVKLCVTLV